MRSALFSPEDKANLLRPRSNATKLPYPFKPAPQGNVELGAKAKAALSAHIEAFEERLSENDSPGIREMLIDDARVVYDAELKACGEESEDAFLLYLLRPVTQEGRQQVQRRHRVVRPRRRCLRRRVLQDPVPRTPLRRRVQDVRRARQHLPGVRRKADGGREKKSSRVRKSPCPARAPPRHERARAGS